MQVCSLAGGLLNVLRLPERWLQPTDPAKPAPLDYALNSHQVGTPVMAGFMQPPQGGISCCRHQGWQPPRQPASQPACQRGITVPHCLPLPAAHAPAGGRGNVAAAPGVGGRLPLRQCAAGWHRAVPSVACTVVAEIMAQRRLLHPTRPRLGAFLPTTCINVV